MDFLNFNLGQYQQYLAYLPVFAFSILVALLTTPIAGYIARKLKVLGYPPSMRNGNKASDTRHLEKQPTPLLGGLAVIVPFVILILVNSSPGPEIVILLIAVSILTLMGVIDDIHELSGTTQLIVQLFVGFMVIASVIDLPLINNPLGGTIRLDQVSYAGTLLGFDYSLLLPGDIFLLLWIIICTVSVKVSSGTDGLMEGNSLIASLVFFILSVRYLNSGTALASITFAGLILGFLFFNFYPAKIWSGSAGESSYGFILAIIGVLCGGKSATAIMVLLLPIVDFAIVLVGRYVTHTPENPLKIVSISDKTHLHHKLLDLGLSERRVAMTEYVITAMLGAIALAATGALRAFALLGSVALIGGAILFITTYVNKKKEKQLSRPPESPEARYSY